MVDAQLIPSDASLLMLRKDIPKRLVLVNKKPRTKRPSRLTSKQFNHLSKPADLSPKLKICRKSRSLDSGDIFPNADLSVSNFSKQNQEDIPEMEATNPNSKTDANMKTVIEENSKNNNKPPIRDFFSSPLTRRKKADVNNDKNRGRNSQKKSNTNQTSDGEKNGVAIHTQALANLEKLITRLREDDSKSSPSTPRLPRSSPSSPTPSKKGEYLFSRNNFNILTIMFQLSNSNLILSQCEWLSIVEILELNCIHTFIYFMLIIIIIIIIVIFDLPGLCNAWPVLLSALWLETPQTLPSNKLLVYIEYCWIIIAKV